MIEVESLKEKAGKTPAFLETIRDAYNNRRKNIIVLTGNVTDIFNNGKGEFQPLEKFLHTSLNKFSCVRMDMANGLSFFDEAGKDEVIKACEVASSESGKEKKSLAKMIEATRYDPLPAMVLLQEIVQKSTIARTGNLMKDAKPLCIVLQYAAALFPEKGFSDLSELDRQRLVFFLNWMSDPLLRKGTLIILINSTKSEVNSRITSLPEAAHIEIALPNKEERLDFAANGKHSKPVFEKFDDNEFAESTAGLTLNVIEDMIESAANRGKTISKTDVNKEVARALEASIGDIVRFCTSTHGVNDIIGFDATKKIFNNIFKRCEDPKTAIPAVIVSGSNGTGKTYQVEAFAHDSGWSAIELTGLRGSYFGETDKFFEKLRFYLGTFGRTVVMVDEAHTAFGSAHGKDVHETEKRLSGNVIKMLSNSAYLGKMIWVFMTSRPDSLDPDIKSRAAAQIPIFDPMKTDERLYFVREIFKRKGIEIPEADLTEVCMDTVEYSARDYKNLVAETMAMRRETPEIMPQEVLQLWSASTSIKMQREYQMLVASQHCSYPQLLPEDLRKVKPEEIAQRIEELKQQLRY